MHECFSPRGLCAGWNHTSDAVLERVFTQHRADFDALLAEVQGDSQLKSIQPRSIVYGDRSINVAESGVSEVERLAARGNSKCFRKTPSAQKNRGAERRYNAFLPHGWTFRYPPKSALESLSGAEPTFTTGCYGRPSAGSDNWFRPPSEVFILVHRLGRAEPMTRTPYTPGLQSKMVPSSN